MTTALNKFVIDDTELHLDIQSGVFVPTATTTNLINSVKCYMKNSGKLLDLGAGCGVVGITLSIKGLVDAPLYASDLSECASECISKNCDRYDVPVVIKEGSLLEPWVGEKFDIIVESVSGIAKKVANVSPWYTNNIPCDCGEDGTLLVNKVLKESGNYLKKNGKIIFPIVSFSDKRKILKIAKKYFKKVQIKRDIYRYKPLEFFKDIKRLILSE